MSDREHRDPGAPEPDTGVDDAPGALPSPPRLRDFTKLPLAIVAAMFAAGALLYPSLPSPIPTHWGPMGTPDAFSPKSFGSVFLLPLIALAVYALLVVVPYLDPKRRNLKLSMRAYNVVIDGVTGLMAVVFAASMIAAFDPSFGVSKVILVAEGLLFIVIGNYMTTVKQNWTFGVRVSWTLSDDVVWRKTNRLGGYLFVAAGLVSIGSVFLPAPLDIIVMLTAVFSIVIVTFGYSYLLFRKRHPEA